MSIVDATRRLCLIGFLVSIVAASALAQDDPDPDGTPDPCGAADGSLPAEATDCAARDPSPIDDDLGDALQRHRRGDGQPIGRRDQRADPPVGPRGAVRNEHARRQSRMPRATPPEPHRKRRHPDEAR